MKLNSRNKIPASIGWFAFGYILNFTKHFSHSYLERGKLGLIKENLKEAQKSAAVMGMINIAHLRHALPCYGLRGGELHPRYRDATCPSQRTSFMLPRWEFIRFHTISTFYLYSVLYVMVPPFILHCNTWYLLFEIYWCSFFDRPVFSSVHYRHFILLRNVFI